MRIICSNNEIVCASPTQIMHVEYAKTISLTKYIKLTANTSLLKTDINADTIRSYTFHYASIH